MNKNLFTFLWLLIFAVSSQAQTCNLNVTFQNQIVQCNGQCTGSSVANVTGAMGQISYSWSNGQTTQTATNLCAGAITVTVSDGWCSLTKSTNIGTRGKIGHTDYQIMTSCYGVCDGQDSLHVSGGTPPYTYLWNTGATTAVITGLCAGTYSVTTTDAYGCQNFCRHHVVSEPPLLTVTGESTPVCHGSCNGTVTVHPRGGTPPYTITWDNIVGDTAKSGLCAATYHIMITDAHGCTTSIDKSVDEINTDDFNACTDDVCDPSTNTVAHNPVNTDDQNLCTDDGCDPASGVYHNPVNTDDQNVCTVDCCNPQTGVTHTPKDVDDNNVCTDDGCDPITGIYHNPVNVDDQNVCTDDGCDPVTGPYHNPVNIDDHNVCTVDCCTPQAGVTHTPKNVDDNNVCTTDGCDPVTGIYHNPVTTNDNNVCTIDGCDPVTGVYHNPVDIDDHNPCTTDACDPVNGIRHIQNPPPSCLISGGSSCCMGGSVQLCAPAGLASYLWSTGATTQCINVNATGNYTVTVTNATGCSNSCNKYVTVNIPPTCSINGNSSCCAGGSVQLCAPAGLASYRWSTGATTQCINVNATGNYTVTVTNSAGCSSTCDKYVTVNGIPSCTISGNSTVCSGGSIALCAPAGLAAYRWSTGATTQCINVSATGTYTVTVTNSSGCSSTCNKSVTVYPVPSCLISGNTTCMPGSSSQLCAPSGAASYLWSTGATTQCITVNTTNTYTVTVTNSYGCSKTCSTQFTVDFWGCTLGFWKTHTSIWDNSWESIPHCVALAVAAKGYSGNGTINASFRYTFGLTTVQMNNALLNPNITLLDALNLGGGGFEKLARQGVAALLNTCGLNGHYAYNASTVITNIHNAFVNNTAEPLATVLADANTLPPDRCPSSGGCRSMMQLGVITDDIITATAYPNPFTSEATIQFMFAEEMSGVTVEVYNANGSKVAELFNGTAGAGELYKLQFNADHLAQGVYTYRINTAEKTYYNKLVLMK